MNKNRKKSPLPANPLPKKSKFDSSTNQSDSSSEEVPANLISSCSTPDDTEIPETPPDDSPSSTISASPTTVNLIEDSPSPIPDASKINELEMALVQEIESQTSSSSSSDDDTGNFDITALIESESEVASQDLQRTQLPAALNQPYRPVVQPKDTVDIPLTLNAPKHPLSIISSRPVPVKNGLADELKKVLSDYRSKENFWQHDYKMGFGDPNVTELVHVKSIKKFHSYCLLVNVQRIGQGDEAPSCLLLNLHWDVCFKDIKVGDKLIVNFRQAEPIRINDKALHFFPFVRRQIEGIPETAALEVWSIKGTGTEETAA